MSSRPDATRRYSARRFTAGATVCPACVVRVPEATSSCPACGFTGGDTMAMFPIPLPPLGPMLDAAGLWTPSEHAAISRRVKVMGRRFPQIRWSVCSIDSEGIPNLRLFGFWMLNVSPLAAGETEEDRAWTILMVINAGKVALVPGYGVEPWVSDDLWQRALREMSVPWAHGEYAAAIQRFFKAAEKTLTLGWKRMRRKLRQKGPFS